MIWRRQSSEKQEAETIKCDLCIMSHNYCNSHLVWMASATTTFDIWVGLTATNIS